MRFNNVYIEKEILKCSNTINILDKLNYGRIILCDKYSEVFNPNNQNFRIQKDKSKYNFSKKKKKNYI